MNIANQKQTHRYRKQTSNYQQGEGRGGCKIGVWDWEMQTTMCKIYKQQGYIVQHRELFCFVITFNAV